MYSICPQALTSLDLSFDKKFAQTQSQETLPLSVNQLINCIQL